MNAPLGQFPHCDPKVLHAPNECKYCDSFPELQTARTVWGINYTGHRVDGMTVCPAENARPLKIINRWHGNVPVPEKNT